MAKKKAATPAGTKKPAITLEEAKAFDKVFTAMDRVSTKVFQYAENLPVPRWDTFADHLRSGVDTKRVAKDIADIQKMYAKTLSKLREAVAKLPDSI